MKNVLHSITKPVLPNGGEVCILGSTGSVGVNTLDVLSQLTDRDFRIKSLVCGRNTDLLIEQALKFKPSFVGCLDKNDYLKLKDALPKVKIFAGTDAILELCDQRYDYVMSAIVGQAGLLPTITATQSGTVVALANKECVVVGGYAFTHAIAEKGGTIFPVDSEHSALYHLKNSMGQIDKYIITASGGPFLDKPLDSFDVITIEETLKHPNWSMGAKISVDSATMANKGLELIEAKILFNLENHQIDAIIHPQSFIHGIVHFHDGSYKMYACATDMRIPIAASLNYGAYHKNHYAHKVDLEKYSNLSFRAIDEKRFPCFFLAKKAMQGHHFLPACFNAANEVAVASYLNQEIRLIDIAIIIENVITYVSDKCLPQDSSLIDLSAYLAIHHEASQLAHEEVCKIKKI